jgi:hypothetical protein
LDLLNFAGKPIEIILAMGNLVTSGALKTQRAIRQASRYGNGKRAESRRSNTFSNREISSDPDGTAVIF